jgi:hypothetical protein
VEQVLPPIEDLSPDTYADLEKDSFGEEVHNYKTRAT